MGKTEKWDITENVQYCNWAIARFLNPLKAIHNLSFSDIQEWDGYAETWIKILSLPKKKTWAKLVPIQKRAYILTVIKHQVYYLMRRESRHRSRHTQLTTTIEWSSNER